MTQPEIKHILQEAPDLHALRHFSLTRLVTLVDRVAQLSLRDRTILIGRLQGLTPAELGMQLGLPESEIAHILTRIVVQLEAAA